MSLFRNALLIVAGLVLTASPLYAAVLDVSGDQESKPPTPGFFYQRAPFDCTPVRVIPLAVDMSSGFRDSTTGGVNQVDGYPCAPWSEKGPEHVYQLDVAPGDTLQFWAGLTDIDPQIDHDLFLLNACDNDSCRIGANTELSATLTGGTYYLVIDGAGGDEGPYTLEYSTSYVGLAPLACLTATPVDIAQGEVLLSGSLFIQFNSVQTYECSDTLMRGGEKWYSLTLPAPVDNQWGGKDFSGFKVEFEALYQLLDVGLWLFDGCGTNPACLDFVNEYQAGIPEQMSYTNETDEEITVYLGIDCWRNPSESATGSFTVKITSDTVVPTEKKSFGSLRSLYR
jgi:hypothetical protein